MYYRSNCSRHIYGNTPGPCWYGIFEIHPPKYEAYEEEEEADD
ncbi:MAG TPA: hypothetical protein ACFYEJ_04845 [Candidatus Wujingus californicus]